MDRVPWCTPGLATNTIFFVSFLWKIIDLPGGQVTLFRHQSLIVKSQRNRIELVTRPGVLLVALAITHEFGGEEWTGALSTLFNLVIHQPGNTSKHVRPQLSKSSNDLKQNGTEGKSAWSCRIVGLKKVTYGFWVTGTSVFWCSFCIFLSYFELKKKFIKTCFYLFLHAKYLINLLETYPAMLWYSSKSIIFKNSKIAPFFNRN